MTKTRFFGSRNVPKVAKMAVVIYLYTWESKHEYYTSESAKSKAKSLTRKMCHKLIKRITGSKYDFDPGRTNILWSEHLTKALIDKDHNQAYMFKVWMTVVNQYMHEVIHNYCQDYDPADNEAKKPDFFNEIFAELKAD